MKNFTQLTQSDRRVARTLSQFALLAVPCLFAVNAQAATASGTFNTVMNVNSPVCTVATTNATITLPVASSPNQTMTAYLTANGITTANVPNGIIAATGFTSSTLNQTATITCTTASTPILGFVVAPAAGASLVTTFGTDIAFLTDTGGAKAGGTGNNGMWLMYDQVSVNGTAAPFAYVGSGSATPYATTFTTAAVANGAATVVWRPILYIQVAPANPIGNPTGGSYSSPGQIVVNY